MTFEEATSAQVSEKVASFGYAWLGPSRLKHLHMEGVDGDVGRTHVRTYECCMEERASERRTTDTGRQFMGRLIQVASGEDELYDGHISDMHKSLASSLWGGGLGAARGLTAPPVLADNVAPKVKSKAAAKSAPPIEPPRLDDCYNPFARGPHESGYLH